MLTRSGLGAIVIAALLAGLGAWWQYEELVVAAAGILAIVLASVWSARRPLRGTVTRRIATPRVPRGDPIRLVYRVRNTTRFRTGRATIVDRCDSVERRTDLAPVPPHSAIDVAGSIPTHRRGVFPLGPFDIERVDSFSLAVGSRRDDSIGSVTVHPRIYPLIGPDGSVRAVESETVQRRSFADPLSGFVSLREYVTGDDPRLIHWPTTARTGVLMVREHVEVRRPEFTVVLDTADTVGTDQDFEEAVDVAATLSAHAIRYGLDVVVRTTDAALAGRRSPIADQSEMLDFLTPVQRSAPDDLLSVSSLFTHGFEHSSVVLITGPTGPSSRFAALGRMVVVRVGAGAQATPGVVVAAQDAADFVMRWKTWV